MGRRERIDQGELGVIAGHIASAAEAAALLRRAQFRTVTNLVGDGDVVIDIDRSGELTGPDEIPVGVDGEALTVPAPVRCSVRPKALRVRIPRNRPGVPLAPEPINLKRLAGIALGRYPGQPGSCQCARPNAQRVALGGGADARRGYPDERPG